MSALWTSVLVLAPLDNVPDRGYDAAAVNAEAAKRQGCDRLMVCEGWNPDTQEAFRDVFGPDWIWWQVPGESVFLGADGDVWTALRRRRYPALASPAIDRVSDSRDVLEWDLKHRLARRVTTDDAAHPCPIPTVKAPDQVPEARQAHRDFAAAATRMSNERRAYPRTWGIDFNQRALMTGPNLQRGQGIGSGIIRAEMHHSRTVRLTASAADPFRLPRSNHPGLRIVQRAYLR